MRPIDGDRLSEIIRENVPAPYEDSREAKEECLRAIEEALTIDAVPVVRCKDCKNKGWVQEPCRGKSVDYCKVWDCTLRNLKTTFCSYGERKEVNNES